MLLLYTILKSPLFWISYVGVSLFIGTLLLRRVGHQLYVRIKSEGADILHIYNFDDVTFVLCPLFAFYVMWPCFVVFFIVVYLLKFLKFIFLNSIIKTILTMDKIIPNTTTKNNND